MRYQQKSDKVFKRLKDMSGVMLEIILIDNEHSDCPFCTGNQLNYDYVSHTKYFASKLNYFNSKATLVSRLMCEK